MGGKCGRGGRREGGRSVEEGKMEEVIEEEAEEVDAIANGTKRRGGGNLATLFTPTRALMLPFTATLLTLLTTILFTTALT